MKNAKQQAKAQANIKAAEQRLARLQERQKAAAKLRQQFGYVGGDDDVIRRHEEYLRTVDERYVNTVLYACNKVSRIVRSYMHRSMELPIDRQAYLIREFLGRPQNKVMAATVAAKLQEAGLAKAA